MLRRVATKLLTLATALALFGLLAVAGLGWLFLQDEPLLPAGAAPGPEDVANTRTLVRNIRAAAAKGATSSELVTSLEELNRAMRLGARLVPGFRGEVAPLSQAILAKASIPIPWITGQKWLNIVGRIPEFDGTVPLDFVTVGDRSLPPELTLSLFRIGANLGAGNQLGDTVLGAATAMQIEGEDLRFRIALDDMGKNGVMRGTFRALRGAELPTQETIEVYHQRLREAMESGQLPQTGSFLPYLSYALNAAYTADDPAPLSERYTASILALAKVCGAGDFSLIVGRLVFKQEETPKSWSTSCEDITLSDRIDSRRHFVTSAALQAISNSGFAISVGEFKELYDTISGAGGFDFTDLAANLSGIELSDTLMMRPERDWPFLLEQVHAESDVIVSFDGIPDLMPREAFEDRFGTIESPEYLSMASEIETRIKAMPLHQLME
ncbi:MAG: hypothetical protein AAGI03_06470 [Pseudomonadota bacterium]